MRSDRPDISLATLGLRLVFRKDSSSNSPTTPFRPIKFNSDLTTKIKSPINILPSSFFDFPHSASPPRPPGEKMTKTAARRALDTPEISSMIFEILNVNHRGTLAGMMRLEKAAVERVSTVLYRRVTSSLLSRTTKTDNNQYIFDSIRILDLNPPPFIPDYSITPDSPNYLTPKSFSILIAQWRKTCPQLREITNLAPSNEMDDHYTIRIHHDVDDFIRYSITIESHLELPLTSSKIWKEPTFPPIPNFGDIPLRHTIILHLTRSPTKSSREKWRKWLYLNPDLDRRIVGIDHSGTTTNLRITTDDIRSYLISRHERGCEPLSSLTLPYDPTMTRNELREIFRSMDGNLRCLTIDESILHAFPVLQTAIDLIDRSFPHLQSLTFGYTRDDNGAGNDMEVDDETARLIGRRLSLRPALSGMSSLRILIFEHFGGHATPKIHQSIGGLGCKEAVYLNLRLQTQRERLGFDSLVKGKREGERKIRQVVNIDPRWTTAGGAEGC